MVFCIPTARRFSSNVPNSRSLALSANHFFMQEKVPTGMHSVRLEPAKLFLIGTRTTYQATGTMLATRYRLSINRKFRYMRRLHHQQGTTRTVLVCTHMIYTWKTHIYQGNIYQVYMSDHTRRVSRRTGDGSVGRRTAVLRENPP